MKLIIAYWQLQSRMIWRYRSVGHPVEVVQFSKQTVSVYGISAATIIVDWKRGVKYIKVIALLTPLQTFQGSVPRRLSCRWRPAKLEIFPKAIIIH